MKAIRIGNEIISLEKVKKVRTINVEENVAFIFQYFTNEKEVWSAPVAKSSADTYLDMILKILKERE